MGLALSREQSAAPWHGTLLTEKTDALDCPRCDHPTYTLALDRRSGLRCPACAGQA